MWLQGLERLPAYLEIDVVVLVLVLVVVVMEVVGYFEVAGSDCSRTFL